MILSRTISGAPAPNCMQSCTLDCRAHKSTCSLLTLMLNLTNISPPYFPCATPLTPSLRPGVSCFRCTSPNRAYNDMVGRHGLDDSNGTGSVCWVKADLRVPSEAIAGAEKVCVLAVGELMLTAPRGFETRCAIVVLVQRHIPMFPDSTPPSCRLNYLVPLSAPRLVSDASPMLWFLLFSTPVRPWNGLVAAWTSWSTTPGFVSWKALWTSPRTASTRSSQLILAPRFWSRRYLRCSGQGKKQEWPSVRWAGRGVGSMYHATTRVDYQEA